MSRALSRPERVGSIRLLAGRRRAARHRCSEAALSFEASPRSKASTEMSSSSAGQWMPMPGPINFQRRRSLGVPAARRGYHLMGTDTVRPSRNSTVKTSAVTLTDAAAAVSLARLEVLMPRLHQLRFVVPHQHCHSVEFCLGESMVVFHANRTQPELRCLLSARHERVSARRDHWRRRRTGTDRPGTPSDSQGDSACIWCSRQVDPANVPAHPRPLCVSAGGRRVQRVVRPRDWFLAAGRVVLRSSSVARVSTMGTRRRPMPHSPNQDDLPVEWVVSVFDGKRDEGHGHAGFGTSRAPRSVATRSRTERPETTVEDPGISRCCRSRGSVAVPR